MVEVTDSASGGVLVIGSFLNGWVEESVVVCVGLIGAMALGWWFEEEGGIWVFCDGFFVKFCSGFLL